MAGFSATEQLFNFAMASDLSTAHLTANILVVDDVNSRMVTVPVDLSWQANGDKVHGAGSLVNRERGYVSVSTFNGEWRDAIATGTIEYYGENMIPYPSMAAQIQNVKSGSLTVEITKP